MTRAERWGGVVTMEIKEITEGPVRQLTLAILQGWEPAPPPTELEVHRFDWGHGLPLPAVARKLNINGSQLTVVCRATLIDEMRNAFMNDALRNKPVEGEAADGYLFSAQYAHVRHSTLVEYPFECVNWTLKKHHAKPVIWVSWFEEGFDLRARNLGVHGVNSGYTTGLRLEGQYIHYLMPWRLSNGRVWYIVEVRDNAPLDDSIFRRELNALQFVLGRPLDVRMLYGINEVGDVVTYAGRPLTQGHLPRDAADRPPVGYSREHAPTVALFRALCNVHDEIESDLLSRCIGYYLHSLVAFVEVQSLQLHVAVEAIARHLWLKESKKEPKMYRSRHREWLDWCNEHAKEIRALALPGKEDRLLQAVRMADMSGASAIVVEVCSRIGLAIDDVMKNALETRNDVAHDGSLPFIKDIDQFIILVDAPRTLLIALIAKLVTYNGPILGYHSRADSRSPSWWVEGQIPADAEQKYQVTSGTRSADS